MLSAADNEVLSLYTEVLRLKSAIWNGRTAIGTAIAPKNAQISRYVRLMACVLCAMLVTPTAFAQDIPEGAYVRTSSGDVFLIQNGQRVPIAFAPATDEQIAAIPMYAPPVAAPAPGQPNWVQVARWTGNGDKTTEPFTVGAQWRIIGEAKTKKTGNLEWNQLCILAKNLSSGRSGDPGGCWDGSMMTYAYTAGTFALEIMGANGGWTVTDEDLR